MKKFRRFNMIRNLFIVAGAGFVLTLGCLAGAAALVKADGEANNWTWAITQDNNITRFSKAKPEDLKASIPVKRTLDWAGDNQLIFDLPAEVIYTQGPTPMVSVEGSKRLTDRVRLEKGRLFMSDEDMTDKDVKDVVTFSFTGHGFEVKSLENDLKVIITAPSVNQFTLNGSGDLKLKAYDQALLDLNLSGSGHIEVSGKAKAVKLAISGSGEADLSDLTVDEADVSVSGSGDATLAPTQKAKIDVSGSGNVTLTTKPADLKTTISGSGNIDQAEE
jgi:hypothetical protein